MEITTYYNSARLVIYDILDITSLYTYTLIMVAIAMQEVIQYSGLYQFG